MATRGRKPKPTAAKIRAGNPGRRPLDPNEPQPEVRALPCPRHLGKIARAEWRRVAPGLVKRGILTSLDRGVLVAYCECWRLYVEAQEELSSEGNLPKLVKQMTDALRDMVRYAAELGMTPSSRSRVEAVPRPKDAAKDKTRNFKIAG